MVCTATTPTNANAATMASDANSFVLITSDIFPQLTIQLGPQSQSDTMIYNWYL
jgi:hypothetical protein